MAIDAIPPAPLQAPYNKASRAPAHAARHTRQAPRSLPALLQGNPNLWRGCDMAGQGDFGIPTGFPGLDNILPGRGWPRRGLIEVVTPGWGMGELQLLMPLMRSVIESGKWILWISPPFLLYGPALQQAGVDTDRVVIVDPSTTCKDALWSMEKALQTSNCGLVLAWQNWLPGTVLRRLQLAAESGGTLGVLFKRSVSEHSHSRLTLKIKGSGGKNDSFSEVMLAVVKARGNFRPLSVRLNLYDTQQRPRPSRQARHHHERQR